MNVYQKKLSQKRTIIKGIPQIMEEEGKDIKNIKNKNTYI